MHRWPYRRVFAVHYIDHKRVQLVLVVNIYLGIPVFQDKNCALRRISVALDHGMSLKWKAVQFSVPLNVFKQIKPKFIQPCP